MYSLASVSFPETGHFRFRTPTPTPTSRVLPSPLSSPELTITSGTPDWMRRFAVELLRESPSPALRSCAALANVFHPLARFQLKTLDPTLDPRPKPLDPRPQTQAPRP